MRDADRGPEAAATLPGLLSWRARVDGERRAYTFLPDGEAQEEHVTYTQMDRRARAIAARMQAPGVRGERALLLYPPGLEYVCALFGCFYAGVIAVPVYPPRRNKPTPRLQSIIADCAPTLVLTTAELAADADKLAELMPELAGMRWVATDGVDEAAATEWADPGIASGDVSFLQYTSGSTAAPKGVMVSHGNLLHNLRLIEVLAGYTPDDRSVIWLPPYHDMGLIGGILQPLYSGYWAALMPPVAFVQRPARWLEAITRYRATTSGGPNFAYDLCVHGIAPADRERLDLSSWKLAFNGAEPVRQETLDAFSAAYGPYGFRPETFYPCYGLAEGTLMVTGSRTPEPTRGVRVGAQSLERHAVAPPAQGERSAALVGCGRSAADQDVRIVDPETFTECPPDRVGEVWVRGPSVTLGYWGRAEETERTFHARIAGSGEGPYLRTGDLGFLDGEELYITGRIKDLIIVRGRNHYPHDLEQTAARAHPSLRPGGSAAFSVERDGEERVVIVQEVSRHANQADVDQVAAAIRNAVADEHEVQVHAVVVVRPGTVPKTSSGKIQRLLCRADYLAGTLPLIGESVVQASVDAAPVPELTREALRAAEPAARAEMLAAWLRAHAARAAGVPADRLDGRSLPELGLDSLGALGLAGTVEAALGVRLPPARLLEEGGIDALAAELLAAVEGEGAVTADAGASVDDGPAPLSPAQARIWFLHHLRPEASAYNLPLALRIRGALDFDALGRALDALLLRHPVLRAVFPSVDGTPVQVIRGETAVPLAVDDVSSLPADAREGEAERIAREVAAAPFDLAAGPLFRVRLIRLSEDEHRLVWVFHHVVGDGVSAGVMLRDLARLYEAERTGAAADLPPLSAVRAADAAAEDAGLAWWRERLRDLPVLDLPADRPRPAEQSFRGGVHRFEVPADVAGAVRALAREEGATLFMALLAAFQLLAARRAGSYDVAVGVPVSVRGGREADVVGPLLNTLALRSRIVPREGFRALLARTRRETLEAFARQDTPFERVVEAVRPGRDLSGNPLFQTMLAFQGAPLDAVHVPGATWTPEPLHAGGSILDLTLYVWERADGALAANFEYATDLFDAATAELIAGHFAGLLRAAAAQPERPVAELEMLSADERRLVLEEWSRGAPVDSAECLHTLFSAQAARTPDAPALRFGGRTVTYAELEAESNRIAHHLVSRGTGPESRVGVCLERTPRLIAAMIGVLKAGAAYVPLDPAYPADRLAYMVEDAGAALVITDARRADGFGVRTLSMDAMELEAHPSTAPRVDVDPRGLAYLLYTSGSTGRPKGVLLEHRGAAALVRFLASEVSDEDRAAVLFSTSVSFDVSVGEIFGTLCSGGTLVMVEHALALPEVADEGVRVVVTVPSAAAELLRMGGIPGTIRQFNLAGEALPAELVRGLYALGHVQRVLNLYGPTEDTVYATWTAVPRDAERVRIGRPLPGRRSYVLDASGAPVPVGVAGELHLGGIGIARGYQGQPALTAERFVPDPYAGQPGARMYRTGDRARWVQPGEIEYLGRMDAQLKVRGYRIEPGEVEAVLRAHPAVAEAVVEVRGTGAEARLAAWLVAADGAEWPPADALRGWARERLPEHMVPAAWSRVDALPRTTSGKIDRRGLPEPEVPADTAAGYVPPRGAAEEAVAAIWAEVLGRERIGAHDDFFALGGHSLLAIRLAGRLRTRLGIDIPLRVVFDHSTLESFAARVQQARAAGTGTTLPPLTPRERTGDVPLSFSQERLWFLERLSPGAAYVMPAALRLRGALDADALRRALDQVVRRHEALRTGFPGVQGRPVQRIDPPRLPWWGADVSALEPEAREAELRRLAGEEAARPFDVEAGPPLRAGLVRAGEDDHLLFLSLHHLVCDGWSLGVLAQELSALYAEQVTGRPSGLPELPVQYADYALWQREHLSGETLRGELAWWRARLGGGDAPAEVPADHPRPAVRTAAGAHLSTSLDSGLSAGIRALAGEAHATPFMVLLAAWKAVQRHHAGSDRVVVGTDVAGRALPEVSRLVGLFVNQLVLATDVSGNPTFRELLGRVRETTLGAYAHAEVPFNLLVDALNPVRDPGRNPLFQVMFVLDNTPGPELRLPGVDAQVLELQLAGAPFDVSVLISERGGEFHCLWRYAAALFDASTVARLAGHFGVALAAAVADPELRLDALRARLEEDDRARRARELERLREARSLRFRRVAPGRDAGEPEPVA